MGLSGRAIAWLAAMAAGQVGPPAQRRPRGQPTDEPGWGRWLREPRAAVLIALFLIVAIGGGRKLLHGWRARGAVGRLGEADVSSQEVEAAVEFGREGLMDLFRILATAESTDVRQAAGHAISVLWARDELIAEEEKALVRRGFTVTWHARRRYPRGLQGAIPIVVSYGVPFLKDEGNGIAPTKLEWSHTILGARRAALEVPSPWKAGPGLAEFHLIPDDFETHGPHRLVLQARVRTTGLTASWELELPHLPFSFEFDPILSVDALFNQADAARAEEIARAVRLAPCETDEQRASHFLDLNETLALRDPPTVSVTVPLPSDLAHTIEIEFEGVAGRFAAGDLTLSGQGIRHDARTSAARRHFGLGPIARIPEETLVRPGKHRMRAILSANADRGWADPDVRSIWPEQITTEWVEVEIVRR